MKIYVVCEWSGYEDKWAVVAFKYKYMAKKWIKQQEHKDKKDGKDMHFGGYIVDDPIELNEEEK